MRRRRIEVEVVLLHVLAVVAFGVGEPEEPLLEDRVASVPQRDGETQLLLIVGKPGKAVLSPPVGARARLVVREVIPRVAIDAVVLSNGAPLAIAQIGAPLAPWDVRGPRGF